MSILTTEDIVDIVKGMTYGLSIHPSTVEYVYQLMKPYTDAIETATIEEFRVWIPEAFKDFSVVVALESLETYINVKEGALEPIRSPEIVIGAKRMVIKEFIDGLLDGSALVAMNYNSKIILPWDVEEIIESNDAYRMMFFSPKFSTDFVVNLQKFSHQVSLDFMGGYAALNMLIEHDVEISVFGHSFTLSDILGLDRDSLRFNDQQKESYMYSVDLSGFLYQFSTPDFMQGIVTAAQWAGVDHRLHWTNLLRHHYYPGNNTVTEITF